MPVFTLDAFVVGPVLLLTANHLPRHKSCALYAIKRTSEDIVLGSESMSTVYSEGWLMHVTSKLLA